MNQEKILDISWITIVKISVAIIALYLIFLIRDILILFIFALIISVLFNSFIEILQKRKVPRILAVVFVYISIFGIFALSLYLIAPLFVGEIQKFSQLLPQYFEKISPPLKGIGIKTFENIGSFTGGLENTIGKMATNIFNALFIIFGGILSTIFVISLAFFLSLEEKAAEKAIILIFPKKYETYALLIWEKAQKQVAGWFGMRILGCIFVGLLTGLTLLIFKEQYPFSLGLLAGILNFVPFVGPILTGALIFIVVALDSLMKAVFILIIFLLIQQIENNILTPILGRRFIGLPPFLVLIALVVGAKLWGLLGAILAIPLFGILFEFLRDFLKKKKTIT